MDLHNYIREVYTNNNDGMRLGQRATHYLPLELTKAYNREVINTPADPYYNDNNLEAFWNWLAKKVTENA